MIPDEAVRGHTPPPWFRALPGIERIRLWSEEALPWPPLSRLIGIRTTHVVPGAVTLVVPAREALTSGPTALETAPVLSAALEVVCESVMEPGKVAVPLALHATGLRPGRAQPGNMLARCRILNSGRLYVFAEAQLEDPQGRQLWGVGSVWQINIVVDRVGAGLKNQDPKLLSTMLPVFRDAYPDIVYR